MSRLITFVMTAVLSRCIALVARRRPESGLPIQSNRGGRSRFDDALSPTASTMHSALAVGLLGLADVNGLHADEMVRNPMRGIQRRSGAGSDGAQLERWRKPLLTCGILAGMLYVAMTLLVGKLWTGYSAADQTISELSAIGAPTRPLWMALITVYAALMCAFAWTVWKSAPNRALRIVGALLFIQTVFGIFWPPMHQRDVLAAGGGTLTDTLHIVWTIVTSLLFMSAFGFGAAGFGKRFRFYSLWTMAIVFACGAWTGTYAPAIQGNLPTPWVGVWERINTNAFMLWVAVLAVALLYVPQPTDARASRLSRLERKPS